MSAVRCAVFAVLVWVLGLPLLAGEPGLAGRLKESVGELAEARERVATEVKRSGVAVPEALDAALKDVCDQAIKAAALLAERPEPDTMAAARGAWEKAGFARRLLSRIAHQHGEAAELIPAPQRAELWRKILGTAAKAIHSHMANRRVDAIRLETELDIMRLGIEQERERRGLMQEFAEFLEFAGRHQADPRVAEVAAQLKARIAALQKTYQVRAEAERGAIQLEAQRRILEATQEEHERLRHVAERELEQFHEEVGRLRERAERLIDERNEREGDREPGEPRPEPPRQGEF